MELFRRIAKIGRALKCISADLVKAHREITVAEKKLGGRTSKPLILYKYRTLQQFLKYFDDFFAGKLWFADRESLNDPMENVPLRDRLDTDDWIRYNKDEVLGETYDRWHRERAELFGKHLREIEQYKICSLSKKQDNFAMWSHYADDHRGVCLEFEIDPSRWPCNYISAGVEYPPSETPDEIPLVSYQGELTQEVIHDLFYRKLRSWESEAEWRLLVKSCAPCSLEVGRLSRVILGAKCPLHVEDGKIILKQKSTKLGLQCDDAQIVKRLSLKDLRSLWTPCDKRLLVLDDVTPVQQKKLAELVERAVIERRPEKNAGWYIYVPKQDEEHPLGKFETHEWTYEIKEEGVVILRYKDSQPEVGIPRKMHKKPVVAIERSAFRKCTELSAVIIPETVTNIEADAFHGCTGLKGLTIPDSVASIGECTFSGCTSLMSLVLGSGVSNIGDYAFYGCAKLGSITIPSSVTIIGRNAFSGCTDLATVAFEEGSNIEMRLSLAVDSFPGDLREKYLAEGGGAGTYTRESGGATWTKQAAK